MAALSHRVGEAMAERDDGRHRVRIAPAHRGEPVAAALRIHEPDHAEGAGTQGPQRLHHLAQHRVGVESPGHGAGEARHLAQTGE